MKRVLSIMVLSVLCAAAFAQPLLVGHRGCRKVSGVDENTVASLSYAQNVPVDFVEFDVQMTADDRIIVFHGPKVPGLNKDIREMTFAQARAVVLPGGGRMPTLKEWFDQVRKHPEIRVIMELKKNFSHERDRQMVKLVLEEVKKLKAADLVDYTTFSKTMCRELHRLDPAAKILFLQSGTDVMSADAVKEMGCTGISYNLDAWMNNPSIVERSREIGLETTLWLANDGEVIDWAVRHKIDCISVDDPAVARKYMDANIRSASCRQAAQPVKIIFETDMGNDVDDVVALAMLHRYIDDGAAELLAVGINKEGARAAEFVDLMDTWYGHPDIPIGIVHDGLPCSAPNEYTRIVAQMNSEDGSPLFQRTMSGHDSLPDAVTMYRRVLSAQEDGSVTIASVGFSTNLARLLQTSADEYSPLSGPELVKAKVKQLVLMAGDFTPDGRPEYNVRIDIPSARTIFESWPGKVVTSPFELGNLVRYPATVIQNGFTKAPHPLVEAYKAYKPMPYNRQMWDPTAVMFAVEGASGFTVSGPGRISVDENGSTHFEPSAAGDRFYLSVQGTQAEQLARRIVELTADKTE